MNWPLFWGAVSGFLAVALGAFGAHGLRDRVPETALAWWQTGAHYHLVHSVAVIATAALRGKGEGRLPGAILWLWSVGIVLFSGSLYLMTLTGVRALGGVTPFGGVCLLAGWVGLAIAACRRTEERSQ